MKKQLSIWMLCAGSTMNKLLALLAVMAAGGTGLFYLACRGGDEFQNNLVWAFANSHISLLFLVIFLLWTAVLLMPAQNEAVYTMKRLRVSQGRILFIRSCYNALSYVVLWGAQVLLLTALFYWFGSAADPESYGPQSILLAFYRDNTLHSLLPLEDWTRYLRNLAVLIGVSASVAGASRCMRQHRAYLVPLLVLAAGLAIWFPAEIGNWTNDGMMSFCVLLMGGIMLSMARGEMKGEESYGED